MYEEKGVGRCTQGGCVHYSVGCANQQESTCTMVVSFQFDDLQRGYASFDHSAGLVSLYICEIKSRMKTTRLCIIEMKLPQQYLTVGSGSEAKWVRFGRLYTCLDTPREYLD